MKIYLRGDNEPPCQHCRRILPDHFGALGVWCYPLTVSGPGKDQKFEPAMQDIK